MSKISFVLPIYNEQTKLAKCIKSLLDQKECEFEIIASDDCSTDHSKEILYSFKDKITIIESEKERKGASFIRNKLNKLATGDIIAVCDCDYYYDFRGKAILYAFANKPECDVFYSSVHIIDERYPQEMYLQEAEQWNFKSKCNISHTTVAYKKEVALKYPYHELSKDTDLFEFMLLDMHKGNIKFCGCEEPTLIKYENRASRDMFLSYKLKKDMYQKYDILL